MWPLFAAGNDGGYWRKDYKNEKAIAQRATALL
jgi:hypothetical protein